MSVAQSLEAIGAVCGIRNPLSGARLGQSDQLSSQRGAWRPITVEPVWGIDHHLGARSRLVASISSFTEFRSISSQDTNWRRITASQFRPFSERLLTLGIVEERLNQHNRFPPSCSTP
jgi:hypothetical protein